VILVDTNVAIDVLAADPDWLDWSVAALQRAREEGEPTITEVTYAELAARYDAEQSLRRDLGLLRLQLTRAPDRALFLAGRAFVRYRAAGGRRTSLLADFFIGAHAEAAGVAVLTRDPRRYRSYFPAVRLITP
jgi:predicted nucleic acid-binding protein